MRLYYRLYGESVGTLGETQGYNIWFSKQISNRAISQNIFVEDVLAE